MLLSSAFKFKALSIPLCGPPVPPAFLVLAGSKQKAKQKVVTRPVGMGLSGRRAGSTWPVVRYSSAGHF